MVLRDGRPERAEQLMFVETRLAAFPAAMRRSQRRGKPGLYGGIIIIKVWGFRDDRLQARRQPSLVLPAGGEVGRLG